MVRLAKPLTARRVARILRSSRWRAASQYHVDPDYPGPGRFKGAAKIVLKDGREFEEVEEYNRGSAENPMTYEELRAKFDDNAGGFLSAEQRDRLAWKSAVWNPLLHASTLLHLPNHA